MTSKKRRCECLLHLDFSWHLGQLKISVGAEISGEVPDCRERVQGRGLKILEHELGMGPTELLLWCISIGSTLPFNGPVPLFVSQDSQHIVCCVNPRRKGRPSEGAEAPRQNGQGFVLRCATVIQLAAGESTRPLVWPDSRRMGLKPWKIRRLIKRRPSNGSRTAK